MTIPPVDPTGRDLTVEQARRDLVELTGHWKRIDALIAAVRKEAIREAVEKLPRHMQPAAADRVWIGDVTVDRPSLLAALNALAATEKP